MSSYNLKLLLDVESAHKKMLEAVSSGSLVLEIGTSDGHMTEYLKNAKGCSVTGVELDPDALKEASKYTDFSINIDIDNTIALDASLHDDFYDYIILGDVIEHVKNTVKILEVLRKKVKVTGVIVVSIPNASHNLNLMQLLKNDYRYMDVGMFDKTHLRLFTNESFSRCVHDANMVIVHQDFTYMTPIYENCTHNDYTSFSLMEREVLLKHFNAHHFQHIFHLSKDLSREPSSNINIDAYWYDEIIVSINGESSRKDVFDKCVDFEVKAVGKVFIKPTMRMRGVKNIKLRTKDGGTISHAVNGFYTISDTLFSFGNGVLEFDIIEECDEVLVSFEYVDVDEKLIESFFSQLSQS